jgi:predicted transcriptional regulator
MRKPANKATEPDPRLAAYEAWYAEQIRLGVEEIEAGLAIPHEEVMAKIRKKLDALKRKHAKAA